MSDKKTHHLKAVESLRGIAAVMIFFFHLVHLTNVPLPESLTFIRTHCGLGVPLFFTLSGFVLAYGYANRLTTKNEILIFYIRRFFRIAPLFYTALLCWASYYGLSGIFYSFRTLILNITFLFGLFPKYHESIVAAGWTIGVEMLFYFLFPLVVLLIPNLLAAIMVFLLTCYLSTVSFAFFEAANTGHYATRSLLFHLPYFIAGLGSYYFWKKKDFLANKIGWFFFAVALLLAWVVYSGVGNSVFSKINFLLPQRCFWALIFGALILHACFVSNRILELNMLCWLGKLSFGIYLLHPIVITCLVRAHLIEWLIKIEVNPSTIFIIVSGITLGIVLLLAQLSFTFIEAPGMKMGKRIGNRFFAKKKVEVSPEMRVVTCIPDSHVIESS